MTTLASNLKPAETAIGSTEASRPAPRRLSLCLVSHEYPPETARGGIGTQTYLKAHGLAALGHNVRVISRSFDDQPHRRQDGLVEVVRVPGADYRFPVYTTAADWLTYSAAVAEAIATEHARSPIDLIDFPEWGCEGFVHLLNRPEWNPVPAVIHLHGPLVMFAEAIGWPEKHSTFFRTGSHMEATCLRLADRVFSSSDCSASWVSTHYGLDRSKIPTLHTGVDVDLFTPRPKPDGSPLTIVFAGNLAANKGVDTLAQAAIRIAPEFPGLKVVLLGKDHPLRREGLCSMAADHGVPSLFDFRGFIDRVDLPHHLSAADVLAAPSVYEGGPGFVYLEAMACGVPVVGCSGSGASEAIIDKTTGLLVPPHDVEALTDGLRRLLTDAALRSEMGRAGRKFVLEHANSRDCVRRISAFYSEVVASGAGPTEGAACH